MDWAETIGLTIGIVSVLTSLVAVVLDYVGCVQARHWVLAIGWSVTCVLCWVTGWGFWCGLLLYPAVLCAVWFLFGSGGSGPGNSSSEIGEYLDIQNQKQRNHQDFPLG